MLNGLYTTPSILIKRSRFVSNPFTAGQWSLHESLCRDKSTMPGVSNPFTAGQWSLPEGPAVLYLETKWASLAPYDVTAKLLHEVLPIDQKHSAATIRNHTLRAARRSEQALGEERAMFVEGCQAERNQLPIPDGPLSVGLDGAIVRARRGATELKTGNLFEVIAGKSVLSFRRDDPEEVPPSSKCFALVRRVDQKPKRRLFELLQSQGMQANQQVTFFSDGGDTVRTLPE